MGGMNPSLRLRKPAIWSPGTGSQPMTLIGRACALNRCAHPIKRATRPDTCDEYVDLRAIRRISRAVPW